MGDIFILFAALSMCFNVLGVYHSCLIELGMPCTKLSWVLATDLYLVTKYTESGPLKLSKYRLRLLLTSQAKVDRCYKVKLSRYTPRRGLGGEEA
jgi:hypothetical protein